MDASTSTTVEAATRAAVRASATPSTVTTMLGDGVLRRTNERQGSDSSEKSFQQGGFQHVSTLHAKRWLPEWANQVSGACFITAFKLRGLVPQGLKPAFFKALNGTAKGVPYLKPIHETRSTNSILFGI